MPAIVLWRTVSTDRPGERISIEASEVVVGRSMTCDHRIPMDLVSRRHLRIRLEGARTWQVEDLESMNGTYVNNERVKLAEIRPGDVIRMGPAGPTLRILSLDPPPEGAKALTEEIALHWMKRVTENLAEPSDSQGMSSIEISAMPMDPAVTTLPPPKPPPPPGRPPRREVSPRDEPPTVPTEEPVPPPAGAPAASPPGHPRPRRHRVFRITLLILVGATLGFLVGLQLLSGILGAEWINAPALFIGIHLVKLGTDIPTGMVLPLLMAAYVAGLFAAAQFPGRGWLVLAILLLLHWGTAVLIRTDPDTVRGILEATACIRDTALCTLTGR